MQVVAVCDLWQTALAKAKTTAQLTDSGVYADYRKLLEQKDVDAVVVATPDHWHGKVGVDALVSGHHLYVEKPMTRHLDEAFRIYDAAKRTKNLVQVGSQGCSDPKYLKAREIVQAGTLGHLLWAQGSYCRNNPNGEWNYKLEAELTPETVEWKTWLGPAPSRPFSAERFFRWRKYWDYGTGIIGDLWPHRLHPLMLALNLNEFPRSVSCMGGDLCQSDRGADGKPNGEPRDGRGHHVDDGRFPVRRDDRSRGRDVQRARARRHHPWIEGQPHDGRQPAPDRARGPYVDEIDAKDETPADAGESH